MTMKLLPALDFVAKSKGLKLLGCDYDDQSEYVILTFDSSVTLIQANDNKVIKSWACTRGHRNTGQAVFAPEEGEFVLIQSENVLKAFKESEYESSETFTLDHKIHTLVRCVGRNPIVMLEDGSVHHLHHILENPREVVSNANADFEMDEIIFTTSFMQDEIKICSICSCKKEYKVVVSSIHKENNEVQHSFEKLHFNGHKLLSATAYPKSKSPLIATAWDDGSICLVRLQIQNNSKFHLQVDKITSLEIDYDVSMTSISEDQIAVVSTGPSVLILDLKFGTTHCRTPVSGKKINLRTMRNFILLESSGQLQKMPFVTGPVTLASAILKQDIVDKNRLPIQTAAWSSPPYKNSLLSQRDQELMNTLLKTKQPTNFDKSWTALWKGKSEECREQLCISKLMQEVMVRLGTTDDFWPRSTISKIISSGHINGRWCSGILKHALKEKDWNLLCSCFQHLNDISEEDMVFCITHLVESSESTIQNGNPKEKNTMADIPDYATPCLKEILQLPYSENELRLELISIPFKVLMKLVKYLTIQIEELSLISTKPSLEQAINWLGMLLDAHLSEIIMLEDAWPAMYQLHEAVKMQSALFKELSTVNKLLTMIESKLASTKRTKDFVYAVQIMEF